MAVLRLIGYGLVWLLALAVAAPADEESDRQQRRTPIVEAYERARDCVVNISATEKVDVLRGGIDRFGFPDVFRFPTERRSVGSGFVIHEDGYIATNAHVVSAGAQLTVVFADGAQYEARVIGRDTARDLAVIRIEAPRPLQPIRLGRGDDLMIGEQTLAIGNPVGLQNTVTTGVISALHRELEVEGRIVYRDVIQTDASINPGNSGGPLLNILGELIGINTAVRTDAQNIGFAIPVGQLGEILPDILDSEKLNGVQVGMRVGEDSPPRVTEVRPGGPADQAGVRTGDVVHAVGGKPLKRSLDFYVALLGREAGDVVSLDLVRNGKAAHARLTLTAVVRPDGNALAVAHLGVTIADVKENAARRFGLRGRLGVIVMAVEPKSPADRADIQPGDLLVSMGKHWLIDVNHVGALLAGIEAGDPIDVGVRRTVRGRLVDGEVRVHAR